MTPYFWFAVNMRTSHVLQGLARVLLPAIESILVTPTLCQMCSGMLPGWITRHYTREHCEIDFQGLAYRAHAGWRPGVRRSAQGGWVWRWKD